MSDIWNELRQVFNKEKPTMQRDDMEPDPREELLQEIEACMSMAYGWARDRDLHGVAGEISAVIEWIIDIENIESGTKHEDDYLEFAGLLPPLVDVQSCSNMRDVVSRIRRYEHAIRHLNKGLDRQVMEAKTGGGCVCKNKPNKRQP
jgi:hypothetical protein